MGDHGGAIIDFGQAIQLKRDYADAYNNRGTAKSALGDHDGAIEDYYRAIGIELERKSH